MLTGYLSDPLRATRPLHHGHHPHERIALEILAMVLPHCTAAALDAGLVTKWLARYPFQPGKTPGDKDFVRHKVGDGKLAGDDWRMNRIVEVVEGCERGRQQMREAGLLVEQRDEPMTGLYGARERGQEMSFEERRLRRRRREAVVVSDGVVETGRGSVSEDDGGGRFARWRELG